MTTRGLLGRPSLATFIQNLFAPRGLPGAQAASRYVGATASGAPTSGSFLLGDYIIDQTGKVYICTVAGSPGTWTAASASISRGAIAARPAAGTAGALYLATDAPVASEDNGTSWLTWLALPLTAPPSMSGWTWSNQGGSTLTEENGSNRFGWAPSASGFLLRTLTHAVPSAPYTVTLGFIAAILPGNGSTSEPHMGLVLRDNSGLNVTWHIGAFNQPYIAVRKWNSDTSFSSTLFSYFGPVGAGPIIWLRFKDDSTNRLYQFSADGIDWITIASESRTTFCTPTKVGVFCRVDALTPDPLHTMRVLHYVEA